MFLFRSDEREAFMAVYMKLNNGLRVVTEQIPVVKSVAVGLWIRAGVVTEDRKSVV